MLLRIYRMNLSRSVYSQMSTSLQSFNNKTSLYQNTHHSRIAQFPHLHRKKRKYQLILIPDRKFLNLKL